MPSHPMVQLSTSSAGYLIESPSEHVAILLIVNGEKWLCPSEDIYRVNKVENIKVEQGHSPGEAATAGTGGQGASFDREDILVMQINEKEARWVTSVMSKDDKGLETYGKGGNAKLCQRAVIHN